MTRFLFTIVITGLATTSGFAADTLICDASKACDGKSSNVEYKACLYALSQAQDAELNTLYKKVRALLRDEYDTAPTSAPKIWPMVRDAQRSWIKFRDNQCLGEAAIAQGGTAGGGWYSDCTCRLTAQRNDNLRFILKNFGANQ